MCRKHPVVTRCYECEKTISSCAQVEKLDRHINHNCIAQDDYTEAKYCDTALAFRLPLLVRRMNLDEVIKLDQGKPRDSEALERLRERDEINAALNDYVCPSICPLWLQDPLHRCERCWVPNQPVIHQGICRECFWFISGWDDWPDTSDAEAREAWFLADADSRFKGHGEHTIWPRQQDEAEDSHGVWAVAECLYYKQHHMRKRLRSTASSCSNGSNAGCNVRDLADLRRRLKGKAHHKHEGAKLKKKKRGSKSRLGRSRHGSGSSYSSMSSRVTRDDISVISSSAESTASGVPEVPQLPADGIYDVTSVPGTPRPPVVSEPPVASKPLPPLPPSPEPPSNASSEQPAYHRDVEAFKASFLPMQQRAREKWAKREEERRAQFETWKQEQELKWQQEEAQQVDDDASDTALSEKVRRWREGQIQAFQEDEEERQHGSLEWRQIMRQQGRPLEPRDCAGSYFHDDDDDDDDDEEEEDHGGFF